MPRRATGRTGVRGSSAETRASHFVPIVVRDDSTDCSAALRRSSDHGNSMRIELPNGVLIHVDADLDGQRLGDLIIAAGQIQSVLPGVAAHGRLQHEVSSC